MLRLPKSRVGRSLFFAGTQFLSYFVFVANTRAFTNSLYGWTAVTDGWLAAQGFIMTGIIAKLTGSDDTTDKLLALLATVAGGIAGSLCSIWVTHHLYGR